VRRVDERGTRGRQGIRRGRWIGKRPASAERRLGRVQSAQDRAGGLGRQVGAVPAQRRPQVRQGATERGGTIR